MWKKGVFVIAEAGVNHNGDINIAYKLIDAAVTAKADAIKFQSFKAAKLLAVDTPLADYQKKNMGVAATSQIEMIASLELDEASQLKLKLYSESKGILWFSTAFDPESLEFLIDLDIPVWKIPSGEITNGPLLRRVGALGKPVILSTGMCSLADVESAVELLQSVGLPRDKLCILHCNTEYPTPFEDVNLNAMRNLGRAFDTEYGYSDHTFGTEVVVAAVALGAKVIEKHFTLDRNMVGPDHKASLEPAELMNMVQSIRNCELAMGDGRKRPSPSEEKNRIVARKSIVASRAIEAGEFLTEDMLAVLRPGDGISPMDMQKVIGRKTSRSYSIGERITW